MCGIAGAVGPKVEEPKLRIMTDALAHRGPDGSGTWVSSCGRVGFGHRRLSILDLSYAGRQPMSTRDGRLTVTYNGEIYNYLELKRELSNFQFTSHSDTEVLIAAYEEWGTDCLSRFNGMFAFALWDDRRKLLFCARDRLGVKPFYYSKLGESWIFGSEVKALLKFGVNAAPNMKVWGRFLNHGEYERPEESFFKDVHALPPGSFLTLVPGEEPKIQTWWSLPERVQGETRSNLKELSEKVYDLLDNAVQLRLRSDVPVGLNLSGGLDSSSVAQSFFRNLKGKGSAHTFTSVYGDSRYDEGDFSVAAIGGNDCVRHLIKLNPEDVPEAARETMRSQEAPYGGIGTVSYAMLHREISRRGLKVTLEGQGGDELFGGYAYYSPLAVLDALETSPGLSSAINFIRELPDPRRQIRLAKKLKMGQGQLYQDGSDFLAPDSLSAFARSYAETPTYPTPFSTRVANALFRDLRYTKLARVLRMNDRMGMAYGVESRQPFLDYRVVELAASVPTRWKIHSGYGKYLLRKAMDSHLPHDTIWAHKRPVVTPQREWMVGPLRTWLWDMANSQALRHSGFFNQDGIEKTIKRFEAKEILNGFPLWQWINTALWFDEFILRSEARP